MVTRYGMVEKLGHVSYDSEQKSFLGGVAIPPYVGERQYSEDTAREIDVAVRDIVNAAFAKATGILRVRREVLATTARAQLATETLTGEDRKGAGAGKSG